MQLSIPTGCSTSKMDDLALTVCKDKHQRCYLGPELMRSLGIRIASPLVINLTMGCKLMCKAWPRNDCAEGYIEASYLVSSRCEIPPSLDRVISPSCIYPVKAQHGTSVTVTVVLSDYLHLQQYRNSETSRHKLSSDVRNILRHCIVGRDLFLKCEHLQLGKLFGVAYVIVKDASADFITVSSKTVVEVAQITSKDRFLQENEVLHKIQKVAGLDTQVATLKDVIMFPSLYPNVRKNLKQFWQRGCLVSGPPGCGKTSLVRQVCREAGTYLLEVHCTDVTGSRPGESEEKLRRVFSKAEVIGYDGPAVLFLDEVDAVCPRRGGRSQESRVTTEFLALLDEVSASSSHLAVIAATNLPQALDPAVMNIGRLEKQVFVGIPGEMQRLTILQCLTENMDLEADADLADLAEATPGYVGADLASLVNFASFLAVSVVCVNNPKSEEVRVSRSHLRDALHEVRPSLQKGSDIFVDNKPVYWQDIGGLHSVKQQIQQAVEWPLKHPEAFARLGISRPRGVMLYGPPGCAKTTLVRAAATSCHVTFLSISAGQLYSPFVGDSERKLSEVFQKARAGAPSILFIDEIDSLVGNRASGGGRSGAQERVLSTLLNEMDGIGVKVEQIMTDAGHGQAYQHHSHTADSIEEDRVPASADQSVLVVAATNRPDRIDKALLRPGRMDRLIYVPLPDTLVCIPAADPRGGCREARREILQVYVEKMSHGDIDVTCLADRTEGFTGAELENFCREAALHALSVDGLQVAAVEQRHFDAVLEHLRPSLTTEQLLQYSQIQSQSS